MRQPQDADPFGAPPDAGSKQTKVIILKHAKANDVEATINSLIPPIVSAAMAVDARTNRLIIRGAADRVAEIVDLIEQLDVPGPARTTEGAGKAGYGLHGGNDGGAR